MQFMRTLGLQPAMPGFWNARTQLSVQEAQRTRFITNSSGAIESGIYTYILNIHIFDKAFI